MKNLLSLLALTMFVSAPLLAQPAEKPAKKPAKAKADAAAKKTTTTAGTARVRFLHAAMGAPSVDIYARETEKIKTGLDYKGLTDYTEVKSGKMSLKVTASNKMEALVNDAATLTKEKWYTIAICMDKATPMMVLINESSGVEMPEKSACSRGEFGFRFRWYRRDQTFDSHRRWQRQFSIQASIVWQVSLEDSRADNRDDQVPRRGGQIAGGNTRHEAGGGRKVFGLHNR